VLVSEKVPMPPVCRSWTSGEVSKFEQEEKARKPRKKSHQTEVKEVKIALPIDSPTTT